MGACVVGRNSTPKTAVDGETNPKQQQRREGRMGSTVDEHTLGARKQATESTGRARSEEQNNQKKKRTRKGQETPCASEHTALSMITLHV